MMARTRDEWRRFFRDFDPYRELTAEEFPRLYAVRPGAASRRLRAAIEVATDPEQVRLLLAGARGSGKSTELLRLRAHLSQGEPIVLPLYVDVAAALPVGGTSLLGWLPLVALEVQAELARYPRARRSEGLRKALSALVGKGMGEPVAAVFDALGKLAVVAADPSGASQAFAAGRSVVASIAATRKVLDALQANLAEGASPAARDAILESLSVDLVALREAVGLPAMLLLDGLDKLATVEEVRHALDDADLLYRMPAGLILSSPLQLASDPQFAANLTPGRLRPVHLHNLPVVDHGGGAREEGIAVLRELFHLRWKGTGLAGPAVLPDPLVDRLARESSGVVREFLELVRLTAQAAREDERDVAVEADLRFAVRERRMAYEFSLTTEDWDQLAIVRKTGERPTARLDELLFTNVVASYPNDGLWFRPNELLIPHLDARAERS